MKKNVLLHAIIIVGCLCSGVLLCAVQTSFLPHYLNDALFVPDLLLCLTVGLGVMAGPVYGAFSVFLPVYWQIVQVDAAFFCFLCSI